MESRVDVKVLPDSSTAETLNVASLEESKDPEITELCSPIIVSETDLVIKDLKKSDSALTRSSIFGNLETLVDEMSRREPIESNIMVGSAPSFPG